VAFFFEPHHRSFRLSSPGVGFPPSIRLVSPFQHKHAPRWRGLGLHCLAAVASSWGTLPLQSNTKGFISLYLRISPGGPNFLLLQADRGLFLWAPFSFGLLETYIGGFGVIAREKNKSCCFGHGCSPRVLCGACANCQTVSAVP